MSIIKFIEIEIKCLTGSDSRFMERVVKEKKMKESLKMM